MPKTQQRKTTDEYLMTGWSKRYGRRIGLDEFREINANLFAFVETMESIERYLKQKRLRKKRSEP